MPTRPQPRRRRTKSARSRSVIRSDAGWATTGAPPANLSDYSIEGIRALFQSDGGIVLGWTHYLAFDLFTGLWIARDADAKGFSRLVQLPFLAATFLAGPIGLLSWLYLASTVTLFAAELNVVRTRRLWPRSLAPPPLGGADERALEGLARQEERLPDQRVEVSFDGDEDGDRDREGEADPGAEGEAGERAAERGPPAQSR